MYFSTYIQVNVPNFIILPKFRNLTKIRSILLNTKKKQSSTPSSLSVHQVHFLQVHQGWDQLFQPDMFSLKFLEFRVNCLRNIEDILSRNRGSDSRVSYLVLLKSYARSLLTRSFSCKNFPHPLPVRAKEGLA